MNRKHHCHRCESITMNFFSQARKRSEKIIKIEKFNNIFGIFADKDV